MTIRSTMRYLGALTGASLKSSLALRGAFLMQAALMMINNLIFFAVWMIFYARFDDIGGWHRADMAALFGITAAGWGLSVVFMGGVRDMARTIHDGELDIYLTQPGYPLVRALASRLHASGWGDLVTAIILLSSLAGLCAADIPLAVLSAICAALIFTASGVILHSVAFWAGDVNTTARLMTEWVMLFSIYPQTIYSGALRVILFTVLPAGFIGYIPVTVLREPSWALLAAMVGATVFYVALALIVFHLGLRRYASGSRFTAAA